MTPHNYLSIALEHLRSLQRSNGEAVLASRLGSSLLEEPSVPHWRTASFPKLKSVLQQLEHLGVIELIDDGPGRLRALPKAGTQVPAPSSMQMQTLEQSISRRLRQDVWHAFVSSATGVQKGIDRFSGALVERAANGGQSSNDDRTAWITPIPQDTQRGWARDFLAQNDQPTLAQDIEGALARPDWYRILPQILRERDPSLAARWNQTRTRHVLDAVEQWCSKENLDKTVVLSAATKHPNTASLVAPAPRNVTQREILLSALSNMPTHELAELSIPPKYILAAAGIEEAK